MSQIRIERTIDAPRSEVWRHLADLGSHSTWMKDAVEIRFLSQETEGLGTVMEVPTRVGPLRTTDIIEINEWTEGSSMSVQHSGLVSGEGSFNLSDGSPTILTWTETLTFPWWWGGRFGAAVAAPILKRIWRGNLDRFATLVESGARSRTSDEPEEAPGPDHD